MEKGNRLWPWPDIKKILLVAVFSSLIGALAATFITTSIIYGRYQPKSDQKPNTPEVTQNQEAIIPAIAREVTPAVVGIATVHVDYDFFYRPVETEAVGSGVIVDVTGYIITNDHVVGNADQITVFLSDGRKFKAQRLYSDPSLDLSVIKIDAPDLVAARLGDSDRVVVGDLAVAIGNPLGLTLQRTVTAGIISALNRMVVVRDRRGETLMQDLIQTDASINPGNSGGPLVNGQGEIIGINTVKASQAEAIGFSIPVNMVWPIVNSIITKGRFDKPYLGIEGIDREIARVINLKVTVASGIYVAKVEKASPADRAGIKAGDIITKLAGKKVGSMAKLRQVMYNLDVGNQVDIEIRRDGRVFTTKIVPLKATM
ncbi:MAG: trypsin-like peptidase domain-containing protein [Tepidanaerobacteraceae bacterium]|nr:trypsin-like peptidase domain-containing protein [Tepidanaerobacteraceae bacterium]